jgi:zinc transport system substrate-binding protein
MIVDLSEGMPLEYTTHSHRSEHTNKSGDKHPDPHYWLDPVLSMQMVDKIAKALCIADPAYKLYYIKNADSYKKKLYALHKDIEKTIDVFSNREYVTFHSAWTYFSKGII